MTTTGGQRVRRFGAVTALLLGSACAASPEAADPVARGRALFDSRDLSPSGLNEFRCSTCHDAGQKDATHLRPGALLAGVTERATFWGGQENDLLRSIDDCRADFMYASTPLAPTDTNADALYAYLASLEPPSSAPVPFTVVREIADVSRGDAERGQALFASTCAPCHGGMHTGAQRLSDRVPILPEDTLAAHPPPTYSARVQRLVFIEKTRHGGFLGYGGNMPPFSLEVLSDAALSDVLEGLGVLGE